MECFTDNVKHGFRVTGMVADIKVSMNAPMVDYDAHMFLCFILNFLGNLVNAVRIQWKKCEIII